MLLDLIDRAVYAVAEFGTFIYVEATNRDPLQWLWFFMPLVILAEGPRYLLPAVGMTILRLIGRLPDDRAQRAAFLATKPSVSVLLVGLNEGASIAKAIESVLELRYPNVEIVVVDDNSTDDMYEKARPYAEQGLIKLIKNSAASGRGGRPSASNLATAMSSGEFVLSIDADTSFDRGLIDEMVGPFYDPRVGAVAGNIKVRNTAVSLWTKMQAIEYLISIGLWKQWLHALGMCYLASGALGAFRRTTLEAIGGWDPELAEDACLSLKVKKAGFDLVFSPLAVAMTNAPHTLVGLIKQRVRWDKGAMRTFFRKHAGLFNIRRHGWRIAVELAQEWFFSVFCTFLYPAYLAWMLWHDPWLMVFAWVVCAAMYLAWSLISAGVAVWFSERPQEDLRLLPWLIFFPTYKAIFRWVRFYAFSLETFRINYEESYLPQTAWRNGRPW